MGDFFVWVSTFLGSVATAMLLYSLKLHRRIVALENDIRLLQKEVGLAGKEKERLENEHTALVQKNTEIAKQLEKLSVSHEFVKESGVLFRKDSDEYTECVYCFICRVELAIHGSSDLKCSVCGFIAPFHKNNLSEIVRHLVTSGKISRTDEQLANLPKAQVHLIKGISSRRRADLDGFF